MKKDLKKSYYKNKMVQYFLPHMVYVHITYSTHIADLYAM